MKSGLSLVELATEIERQASAKKDMIASTDIMQVEEAEEGGVKLKVDEAYAIGDVAHNQIALHTAIPINYYNRMKVETPDLLATNINRWFAKYPAPRLVRTLDGKARAFLSNGYRPLEHQQLAEAVLPVLLELGVEVMSAQITEQRFYIKAVDKRIERDIPSGKRLGDGSHVFFDTCCPAVTISNSEVGLGLLKVETGILTRVCTNLATISEGGMKRRHVGARNQLTEGEEIQHLLSDDTKRATDKAVWLQVRDVVRGAFEEVRFQATLDKMAGLTKVELPGDTVKLVSFTAKKFGLTESEGASILRHLIQGGDLTRYGLFNAVTRTAEDLASYDRASEFEKLGGRLIELPANDWEEIEQAAAVKVAA